MTAKRLKLFNIPGKVLQMDAEHMNFADNSFDFIWSWGVIHHTRRHPTGAARDAPRIEAGRHLCRHGLSQVVVEFLCLRIAERCVSTAIQEARQFASCGTERHRRRDCSPLHARRMAANDQQIFSR